MTRRAERATRAGPVRPRARPALAGDVGLADYVRAVDALGATDDALRGEVAALLGLRRGARVASATGVRPTGRQRDDIRDAATVTDVVAAEVVPAPLTPVPSTLTPLAAAPPGAVADWLEKAAPLPPAGEWSPPPQDPLLHPRGARAIASRAAATLEPHGDVDVRRLIEALCRLEPVVALPRRLVPSVVRGAQIVVDRGEAMEPFLEDERLLVDQLARTIGPERVDVRYVREVPGAPATRPPPPGPAWRYLPPAPGTPVLLVTDLGIASGERADAVARGWERFAEARRARDSRVVAFVPYPRLRWPARLRRTLEIVEWDRGTTAASVRAALAGRGRG